MATLPTLRPTSYDSGVGVNTTAVGFVNDASDATFNQSLSGGNIDGLWRYQLDDMPADFESMDTYTIKARCALSATGDDTWTVVCRLVDQSNVALHSATANQTVSATGVVEFTFSPGAFTSNTKAAWDSAKIVVDFTNFRSMGADGNVFRLYDVWVTGTYSLREEKVNIPKRRASGVTLRTVTAVLQGDQWGKYVVPQVPWQNPVTRHKGGPTGTGLACSFSPDGRFLAVGHDASPFVTIYERSGTTFTKLADPATLPTQRGYGCAWSPDGRFLAVVHFGTPFLTIYERSGTTFTKLANPATLPPDTGYGAAWSPDGRFLAVAHFTTPFVTIYERSGTTFTKLANPATLPIGTGNSAAFSPDGRFLAVAHVTTPFITIYERSGTTFTKLANPATLPGGSGYGPAFSPDGRFLAVAHFTSPFLTIYERSGATFTKLANPATLPTSHGYGAAFSPDGRFLAVAHSTTPYITIYERSGATFTKLADPATLPTGPGNGAAFSPDGRFLAVAHSASPFLTVYESSGQVPRDGYLWMPSPGER